MPEEAKINYKNKGFWIPEEFIEVLSQYICETFESIGLNTFSDNLKDIYEDCDGNRTGEHQGIVNILFNEYLTNPEDKATLINVLEQTKSLILSKGSELSIATLNQFENCKIRESFKNQWSYPIKTQSLVETLSILQQLINGTWTSNNHGVYYQGFPNPNGYEEI